MNCHYITKRETKYAKEAAQKLLNKNAEDVMRRVQMMWMAAMMDAGMSADQVREAGKHIQEIEKRWESYIDDGCADAALVADLKSHGIECSIPRNFER